MTCPEIFVPPELFRLFNGVSFPGILKIFLNVICPWRIYIILFRLNLLTEKWKKP